MKRNKRINIAELLEQHIVNNGKEYFIVLLMFIIGIFAGVLFVNNMQNDQNMQVTSYLSNFIEKFKGTENLNSAEILKNSILQNVMLVCILWFFGTTVIGLPVVFGIVLYRGFCLGYTISATIMVLGLSKGIAFILISLLLQNIIFIPAILAVAVSGFKLYKSIIKDRRKDNIKLEILRHTIFSIVMLVVLMLSSVIEVFISTNILKGVIKYF